MEYINNLETIIPEQFIFKLPTKNKNSKYLNYYKLLYSDKDIHFKYMLFEIPIYPLKNYMTSIQKIKELEYNILGGVNQHVQKNIKLSMYNDLTLKQQKYIHNESNPFIYVKISGVWEDSTQIGLVYKTYYTMSTVKLSNIIC